MSKIEKALERAQQERGGLHLVPVAAGEGAVAKTGTALVSERSAHPETIRRMAESETRLRAPDELLRVGVISRERVEDPVVQVFRELRTKITQQSEGRNCSILVTGIVEGGGSSFVARNLAAAFAFDAGKTALLIDCNLKKPSVHTLIPNWSEGPGLMDYLDDPDVDLASIIYPVGIARFRAVPAGAAREMPAEHFTSLKMRHLMDAVARRYADRFIVIDGPQMVDLADVRILAELSDYVLIVARYGRITSAQIETCVRAVNDRKLLGVVFNDEPSIPRSA